MGAMERRLTISLVLGLSYSSMVWCPAQSEQGAYTIPVNVSEVSLSFSVADFDGRPVEDIVQSDLRLLDNGKHQTQIVKFEYHRSMPLRAGILVDTSRSMLGEHLDHSRRVAVAFADHVLRSNLDEAFVTEFDFSTTSLQGWTNNPSTLHAAVEHLGANARSRIGGTAVYDSVYETIAQKFRTPKSSALDIGNVLLLFSDGEDNASHASLQDVLSICGATQTVIYAFSDKKKDRFDPGERNLEALSRGSGGRPFYSDDPNGTLGEIRLIEAEMRNRYKIVYKPLAAKPDGRFHSLVLSSPNRGGVIEMRSGYYASRDDP